MTHYTRVPSRSRRLDRARLCDLQTTLVAIVVDASVALAWALPDESSAYAEDVLTAAHAEGIYVPGLWAREVANGLTLAYRRRRMTITDQDAFLDALSSLNIRVDNPIVIDSVRRSSTAAAKYELTAYDAAYVELASRLELKLATLDGRMRQAARNAGVSLIESKT